MPVPTHAPNCSTVTFRTTCRDCGASVYYFACNCGSKVFFDHLGAPWPEHANTCLPYLVRLNLEEGHRSINDIRNLIRETADVLGVQIPERAERLLGFAERAKDNRIRVSTIAPLEGIAEINGAIVSVTPQVNIFRHFKVDDGPVGRGILGELALVPLAVVTIREEPDDNNNSRQFEIFVPREWIAQKGLRANVGIRASIAPKSVVGRFSIWYGRSVERQ